MNQEPPSAKRLGVIVAGLVVVAVVVAAIVTSLRPVEDLDPNTPEGAVQAFFRAIEAKGYDEAYALLSAELAVDCSATDLATYISDFDRVVIDDVIATGSVTLVKVQVRHVDATDPLNPYTYTEVLDFEVDRENGRPVISWLPWPFYCGG